MTTPAELSNDEFASRYLEARNRELEERSQLLVARNKTTGQYAIRLKRFLQGCEEWRKARNPSVQEVLEEIAFTSERAPMWTSDLQEAEVWDRYYIEQFGCYAPDVEFVPVQLSGKPIS